MAWSSIFIWWRRELSRCNFGNNDSSHNIAKQHLQLYPSKWTLNQSCKSPILFISFFKELCQILPNGRVGHSTQHRRICARKNAQTRRLSISTCQTHWTSIKTRYLNNDCENVVYLENFIWIKLNEMKSMRTEKRICIFDFRANKFQTDCMPYPSHVIHTIDKFLPQMAIKRNEKLQETMRVFCFFPPLQNKLSCFYWILISSRTHWKCWIKIRLQSKTLLNIWPFCHISTMKCPTWSTNL